MTFVTDQDFLARLPERYHDAWRAPFTEAIHRRLRPGVVVLDVGSGRNPTMEPAERAPDTTYIGLDPDASELTAAGADAYDEEVVADVAEYIPALAGRVDLAISWQVLEHVRDLSAALANLHAYLGDGGTLVCMFSGSWSAFGVANQILPGRVGHDLVERVMRRRGTDRPVFPAYYDKCYDRALRKLMSSWRSAEIVPFFRGASYFHFSAPVMRTYLAYENAISRKPIRNLATHYLLIAER